MVEEQQHVDPLGRFIGLHSDLLALERKAELEQAAVIQTSTSPDLWEENGLGLKRVTVKNISFGLFGRSLVEFGKGGPHAEPELPSHQLSPGDIVGLTALDRPQKTLCSGIVYRTSATRITVAFDDQKDDELNDVPWGLHSQHHLLTIPNDITFRRHKRCLDLLKAYDGSPAKQIVRYSFYGEMPRLPQTSSRESAAPYTNADLNEYQNCAVDAILKGSHPVYIVHGPPGTGKTTTVVEVIAEAVKRGLRVLACAPSNTAVDNLTAGLAQKKVKAIVRMGHPARISESLHVYSLSERIDSSDQNKLVENIKDEMNTIRTTLFGAKSQSKRDRQVDRAALKAELRMLRKEMKSRQKMAMKEVISNSSVVLATLSGIGDEKLVKSLPVDAAGNTIYWDLVVVDECAQALEVSCWMALLLGKRCVLAGDHCQLPPTILSTEAENKGLNVTLMERLVAADKGNTVTHLLKRQYRMNIQIMSWSSRTFYDNQLIAADTVKDRLLCDLPDVAANDDTVYPIILMDTAGCNMLEIEHECPGSIRGGSKANEGEAQLVVKHLQSLVEAGISPDEIAVITPYNFQVETIRRLVTTKFPDGIASAVEVRSVDGFQGREKDVVILSLVRSNPKCEVGFLREHRRLNVAVTRAKRQLCLICDSQTVTNDPVLETLVSYCIAEGDCRTPYEERVVVSVVDSEVQPNTTSGVESTDAADKVQPSGRQVQKTAVVSRETRLRKELDSFVADDGKTERAFPPSLHSKYRRMIHEFAEQLGLEHVTTDDGSGGRYITIRKRALGSDASPTETAADVDDGAGAGASTSSADITSSVNRFETLEAAQEKAGNSDQNSRAPSATASEYSDSNSMLKELALARQQRAAQTGKTVQGPTIAKSKEMQAKRKTATKKDKEIAGKLNKVDDDDIDAITAEFKKANKSCSFPKCKAKVELIGHNCQYCNRRFCLSHGYPEEHGCLDAARKAGREQARTAIREGSIVRSCAASSSSGKGGQMKAKDRAHLSRALGSKIADMQNNRSTSTSSKSSKSSKSTGKKKGKKK